MPGPCHITIVARFAASSWHEVSAEAKSLKAPLFSQLLSGRQPVARAGIIDIIPRAALRRSYQIGGSDRFNYSMAVAVNDLLLVWSCFLEFARRAAGHKDWYTKKDDQQLKSVHKKGISASRGRHFSSSSELAATWTLPSDSSRIPYRAI